MKDDDNFMVGVLGVLPHGASLSGYQENYNFTWKVVNLQNISLTLIAQDSLNASTLLSVQVQLCACQNNGMCTLEGVVVSEENSLVMNCDCQKGKIIKPFG